MRFNKWFSPLHHSWTSFPLGGLSDKIFPSARNPQPPPHRLLFRSQPHPQFDEVQARRNLGKKELLGPPRLSGCARESRPSPGVAPASYLSPSSPGSPLGVTLGQTRGSVRLREARFHPQPPLSGCGGASRAFVFWWFPFSSELTGVGFADVPSSGSGGAPWPPEPSHPTYIPALVLSSFPRTHLFFSPSWPLSSSASPHISSPKRLLRKESRAPQRSTRPRKSHVGTKLMFPFLLGRAADLTTRFEVYKPHILFFTLF